MAINAPSAELLNNSELRKIQTTLLSYGISGPTARTMALIDLRSWSTEELSAIFNNIRPVQSNLQSLDLDPYVPDQLTFLSAVKYFGGMAASGFREGLSQLKAPRELLERSVNEGLALCVNRSGTFSLRKEGYFTISHVWEEGIRAKDDNSGIPTRTITKIFERIRSTKAEWIWLDALSIPGGNRSLTAGEEILKAGIINNLSDIYRNADAVIIFDALVMHLHSTRLVDVAVTLSCGKWLTRLWTYQEIKLSTKALILTASGYVRFDHILAELTRLEQSDSELPERARSNCAKFRELKIKMAQISSSTGVNVLDIAGACIRRQTGNDIDYARALFPVLGLSWRPYLTREEAMHRIYESQPEMATQLIMAHGVPRNSFRPGWMPSYLFGIDGPIGDRLPITRCGVQGSWFSYQIKENKHTWKPESLLLEVQSTTSNPFICGGAISRLETQRTLTEFDKAISQGTAYLLSLQRISDLAESENDFKINVLLVERCQSFKDNDAWIYLTLALTAAEEHVENHNRSEWLILHESPIGDQDLSGKAHSEIVYFMSDNLQQDSEPPLLAAARTSDSDRVGMLLDQGEDIEALNYLGWAPLHVAASQGDVKLAALLLDRAANINSLTTQGKTPLVLAAEHNHTDVMLALLKAGSDPNYSSDQHYSALSEAVIATKYEAAQVLLEHGADPSGPDKWGSVPFMPAAMKKNARFMDLLISFGLDVNVRHSSGINAMSASGRAGNASAVESLVKAGMDVDAVEDGTSLTALYYAVDEQHEEAVKILLHFGADPNRVFKDGWTAVMLAARNGNANIGMTLLAVGANLDCRSYPEKWTALHIAAKNGRRVMVKLLKNNGCDPLIRDSEGKTALDLAKGNGHEVVVAVLEK
ncbi:putative ankyrin repeat protein [Phaeomoniella chlamydospora]|uniref:Putative ankyrin repeat protein n=1 Tax=Phaeomoniella chlamydospora TaxID=158046 RepID=A0A0G2HG59_PHACM|nr:putative ankyrin repeat protein [Phaeomoniella chlamydospora]